MPMPCWPRLMRRRWNFDQLGEDRRNLLPDDPGAVVGNGDPKASSLARRERRPALGDGLELHGDVRKNPGFFACVERVVNGLLHAGQERLARVVKAEEMVVLGEELRDGDRALTRAHLDGGHGGPGGGAGARALCYKQNSRA